MIPALAFGIGPLPGWEKTMSPAPKKETKPKAEKKQKTEKEWSPGAHDAANRIVSLWSAIVMVQSIRGSTKSPKLAESLDRSTTYLKRSAKLLSEEVE